MKEKVLSRIEESTSLTKEEIQELITELKEAKSYIFPRYIADKTGFMIDDVSKALILLCVENYLMHYTVPQFQDKIYLEYAEMGFSFNQEYLLLRDDEVVSRHECDLLTAYKKYKFD